MKVTKYDHQSPGDPNCGGAMSCGRTPTGTQGKHKYLVHIF